VGNTIKTTTCGGKISGTKKRFIEFIKKEYFKEHEEYP